MITMPRVTKLSLNRAWAAPRDLQGMKNKFPRIGFKCLLMQEKPRTRKWLTWEITFDPNKIAQSQHTIYISRCSQMQGR